MLANELLPSFDYKHAIYSIQKVAKLTQTEIAEEIGVSQGRVSQITNNKNKDNLRYEKRLRLAKLCEKHDIKLMFIS